MHIEVEPGNVVVVPAWMLDRLACSAMALGGNRSTVTGAT